MPPRRFSRHSFTFGIRREGDYILTTAEPFRFRELDDNRLLTVKQGETLFSIAGREFKGIGPRPAGLWWIIADFQPSPIHDPTLEIPMGTTLFIPSNRTILEEIFSQARREE